MARPANADSAETRRRILDSALGLFALRGLAGASVRDIARDASVSLAMVHHYYGSKDDLYASCIDAMYAELTEMRGELTASLARGGPLDDLIEHAVRTAYRFARRHQVAVRLLMRSVVETGELDSERRETAQRPFLDQVSAALANGTGSAPASLRLPLQTMSFAVARYAISSERELELVTGHASSAALRAAEDHLVTLARALFPASTKKR